MTLGGLFVIRCLRASYNQGPLSGFYYFRDSNGREIDLTYDKGRKLDLIAIRAGFTFTQRYLSDLKKMQALTDLVDHACYTTASPGN